MTTSSKTALVTIFVILLYGFFGLVAMVGWGYTAGAFTFGACGVASTLSAIFYSMLEESCRQDDQSKK